MTTPKFTPGPLVVSHERNKFDSTFDSLTVIAPDGIVLATINVPAFAPHLDEPIANANLYASAPALYAALEGLLSLSWEEDPEYKRSPSLRAKVAKAVNALALARGEKGGEVK